VQLSSGPKCHLPLLSHAFSFHHPDHILWGVQITKIVTVQSPSAPVASSSGQNVFFSTLLSNTLSLYSSNNVKTKFYTNTKQQAKS
jgi:hypothetical protein